MLCGWSRLRQLRNDPDALVRYQLAFTLGEFNRPGKIEGLVTIAERDLADPWTQAAILSSLAEGAGEVFAVLAGDSRVRDSKPGQDFLRQLVVLVGAKNQPEEVANVLKFVGRADDPALTFTMTRALGDGLQRAKKSLTSAGESVKDILASAKAVAANDGAPEGQRVPAIQLLGYSTYENVAECMNSPPIFAVCSSTSPRFLE